ncbi:hypothetical protein [Accumulibacter sp.]|uniref:hypothetical protein n=1 Tax=Accumulibacter sp. TaxID=2053492 RepID=UPI0028C48ECF|nr:hypothetical protein [Accumulibacter sp.]
MGKLSAKTAGIATFPRQAVEVGVNVVVVGRGYALGEQYNNKHLPTYKRSLTFNYLL